MTPRDLTGVRLSACASCPRRGYYQGVGSEITELDVRDARRLRIRQIQNDALVAADAAEMRKAGDRVDLEMEIPWRLGTGHADLVNHTSRIVYEYTGTKDAELPARKIMQVVGYCVSLDREYPYGGIVRSFDPLTGQVEDYPIDVDELAQHWLAIEAAVAEAIETGVAPDRVCRTPNDGPAMWCERIGVCFTDWEWPDPDVLFDEDAADVVVEYVDAYDRLASLRADVKTIESIVADARDRIRPILQPGTTRVTTSAGEIELRRTIVANDRGERWKATRVGS